MSTTRYVTDDRLKVGASVPQKVYSGGYRVKRLLVQFAGASSAVNVDYIHKYNDYYTGLTVTLTPKFYVESSHTYWEFTSCNSDESGYNDAFSVRSVQLGISWSETGDSDRKHVSRVHIDRAYGYIRNRQKLDEYLFEYDGRYYSGDVTNGQIVGIPGTYDDRDDIYGGVLSMTFVVILTVTVDGETFQFTVTKQWATDEFPDDYDAWYTCSPASSNELDIIVTRQEY